MAPGAAAPCPRPHHHSYGVRRPLVAAAVEASNGPAPLLAWRSPTSSRSSLNQTEHLPHRRTPAPTNRTLGRPMHCHGCCPSLLCAVQHQVTTATPRAAVRGHHTVVRRTCATGEPLRQSGAAYRCRPGSLLCHTKLLNCLSSKQMHVVRPSMVSTFCSPPSFTTAHPMLDEMPERALDVQIGLLFFTG
ncbi:hypothetical protein BS78_03G388400 [Paspalum vaginatum]|nr:hypothetical protein BS78_03G388400 [Paspalum vaginatum]